MVYGVPAGLAALGGGLASGRGANPFNSVFGSVQSTAPRDDSFDKVAQVMQLEQQLSGARAAQQQRQQEQAAALAQQAQAEQLRGQIPENLRELFDVDQDTAIARAFPEQPDPTSLQRNLQAAGLQPGTQQYQDTVLQSVTRPQTSIKTEASIPSGHRAIRDQAGNILQLEAIPGGPADPNKPTTEQRNKLAGAQRAHQQLMGQIGSYRKALDGGVSNLPGSERDGIKTQRTQIKLQLKNLYELGAITGPDEEILNDLIFDPTTASSRIGQAFGSGSPEDRAKANLLQIEAEANRALEAASGNNPVAAQEEIDAQARGMSTEELLRLWNGGQ